MNQPIKLVRVYDTLAKIGHTAHDLRSAARVEGLVKKYKIEILAEYPFGRGVTRMMSEAQAAELIAKHGPKEPEKPADTATQNDLRVGALETKVDRLCARQTATEEALQLLVKQSNLFADRQSQLLAILQKINPAAAV